MRYSNSMAPGAVGGVIVSLVIKTPRACSKLLVSGWDKTAFDQAGVLFGAESTAARSVVCQYRAFALLSTAGTFAVHSDEHLALEFKPESQYPWFVELGHTSKKEQPALFPQS